jgi:serine/threonine-protein phosphatase 2A regulatory subunit A
VCVVRWLGLANGDWFTTRVSACGLFAVTYPHVPEQSQTELRSMFCNLCNDDTPMVRKAAFANLGVGSPPSPSSAPLLIPAVMGCVCICVCVSRAQSFASVIQKNFFRSDIFPIIKSLAADDLDSMRFYTIECCADLGKKLDAAEYVQLLLPLIEGLQDDQSWRVRQQLAKCMPKLCDGVDVEMAAKRLLPVFAKLLRGHTPVLCFLLPASCKLTLDVFAPTPHNRQRGGGSRQRLQVTGRCVRRRETAQRIAGACRAAVRCARH